MKTEGYSNSTKLIDAVNTLPLARFKPTTMTTPPDIEATSCATETSPLKDVHVALVLTMAKAVQVVYRFSLKAFYLFRSQVKA